MGPSGPSFPGTPLEPALPMSPFGPTGPWGPCKKRVIVVQHFLVSLKSFDEKLTGGPGGPSIPGCPWVDINNNIMLKNSNQSPWHLLTFFPGNPLCPGTPSGPISPFSPCIPCKIYIARLSYACTSKSPL